ncbi:MAG: glycosyltransferase family 39 protein [Aureliella sp.]
MKPPIRGTLALLVVAIGLRAAAVVQWSSEGPGWHSNLLVDTDSYLRLAVNLSQSGVYGFEDTTGRVTPSAFRPPLYPWLLSWLQSGPSINLAWVATLNVVFGVAAVWLTWSIGCHIGLKWAWLAGLAVAVDPILLRASQSAMTETLAATLALAVWRTWLVFGTAARNSACKAQSLSPAVLPLASVGIGTLFGLAILARPTAAPWALLSVGAMLVVGSSCWKRRCFHVLIASTCIAVCVVPWTIRNWTQIGKPIWATSHGGYTLLLANNPLLFQHFAFNGPSRNWDAEPFHAVWATRAGENYEVASPEFWEQQIETLETSSQSDGLTETQDDELAYRAAKATIARQPVMFGLSSLYRACWFWAWWPNQSNFVVKLGIGAWYAAWFFAAIGGLSRVLAGREVVKWLPALLLVVTLSGIHSIYWSNMRMRAPVVAGVYLLGVGALGRQLTTTDRESTL